MGFCVDFIEVLLCFVLLLQTGTSVYSEGQMPNFDVPILNVTAVSGTTAVLPCTITGIGEENKVAWVDPRKKLLTVAEKRIITDLRISVERPFTKDWNLHIRSARLNDSGEYECQINTRPVKSMKVLLTIHEPPSILEHSGDQIVREGETVALWCKVNGEPYPAVKWYRQYIHEQKTPREVIGEEGEALRIHNISRYCEDVYECVANNDIEPAASHRMRVTVQFPPEVQLYTNRMSQSKDKETILDCRITASPHGYIVWKRKGREISNSHKYGITVYEDDRYTKTLSLRIARLNEDDYGKYKCYAQNEYGTDSEEMMLFEHVDRRITTTTTTTDSFLINGPTYSWKGRYKPAIYYDLDGRPTQSWDNVRGTAGASHAGCNRNDYRSETILVLFACLIKQLLFRFLER